MCSMFQQVPSIKSLDYIKSLDISKLIVTFQRLKIKFKTVCNHLWFNTVCKKMKVFPNYIHKSFKCNNNNKLCKKVLYFAKVKWLNEEIVQHYNHRNNISSHLMYLHSELACRLHPAEFDLVLEKCREKADCLSHQQFTRQKVKLEKLVQPKKHQRLSRQQHQNTQLAIEVAEGNEPEKFHPRVVNLSDTVFNEEELQMLNNGLNFAPKLNTEKLPKFIDLAVHIDAALDENNMQGKFECKDLLDRKLKVVQGHSNKNNKIIKSIKSKLSGNSLILGKADKGNSIVILPENLYVSKVEMFLANTEIAELNRDPTSKFQAKVIKAVNNAKLILNDRDRFMAKITNPSVPVLYGLIKLHKHNHPIRPVCSALYAPTQNLCKILNVIVPNLLNFKPDYAIKNSLELIDKVRTLQLPHNSKLVSFDVTNLFPSIPTKKLKDILWKDIEHNIDNPEKSSQLKNLIDVCLEQNYFMFNKKIFTQKDGLAMGNSASPLFAEYFMNWFEKKLFKLKNDLLKHVLVWYRYVDDIFCIWTGSLRQLKIFVNETLNKLEKAIQFTVEVDAKSINFLDLKISINNSKLEFEIYRKDTFTDAVIPSHSDHPWNVKLSAFHSMVDRLLRIPMKQISFNKELKNIIKIATNNGYNKKIIYNLMKKKVQQNAQKLIFPMEKSTKIWRKIPYIEETYRELKSLFKKYDVEPAFFNNKSLRKLLTNNKLKQKIENIEKSGVYEIKCEDCSGIYIGKTKRTLKKRFKEHLTGARSAEPQSAISKHLKQTGHKTNIDNVKLIHGLERGKILDKYEILEIKKAKHLNKNILNDQIDYCYNSPLLEPDTFSIQNHLNS